MKPHHALARAIEPDAFDAMLDRVVGPVRYVGREVNAVHGPVDGVTARIAVGVADRYERAMSEPDVHALYRAYNRAPNVRAERAFLPDADFIRVLDERGFALPSLETRTEVHSFDVLHVWVPADASAAQLPMFLACAGIEARRASRDEDAPFVVVSGPIASAPEPIAAFADLVFVGEPEDLIGAFMEQWATIAAAGLDRSARALTLAQALEGVYAPGHFRTGDGTPEADAPGLSAPVRAARVYDLERTPVEPPVVAATQIVRERLVLEASRAPCGRAPRRRSVDTLLDAAERLFVATGLESLEVSGAAIGRTDVVRLLDGLAARFRRLRLDIDVTGLDLDAQRTCLPRFHDSLGATHREYALDLDDPRGPDEIVAWAADVYRAGATQVNATGTLNDADAIGDLIARIAGVRSSGRRLEVTLDWPDPLTDPAPYRDGVDGLRERHAALRRAVRRNRVAMLDPGIALATAVLRRADRSITPALESLAASGFRYTTYPVAPDGDAVWSAVSTAIAETIPMPGEAFPGARWLTDEAARAWAHIRVNAASTPALPLD